MQLTIEHLAPYLPYGLKIQGRHGDIAELEQLSTTSVNIKGRSNTYGMWADITDIKPILRPLSVHNYTKGIEHIMPGYSLNEQFDIVMPNGSVVGFREFVPLYSFICSKHIDIFGLIDAGLAISYKEAGL